MSSIAAMTTLTAVRINNDNDGFIDAILARYFLTSGHLANGHWL